MRSLKKSYCATFGYYPFTPDFEKNFAGKSVGDQRKNRSNAKIFDP